MHHADERRVGRRRRARVRRGRRNSQRSRCPGRRSEVGLFLRGWGEGKAPPEIAIHLRFEPPRRTFPKKTPPAGFRFLDPTAEPWKEPRAFAPTLLRRPWSVPRIHKRTTRHQWLKTRYSSALQTIAWPR